jgi:predicted lactoylglutathione lyase
MSRHIFVNLPVRDLKRSMDFFKGLGFAFNPQFTSENGACMIVSGEGFVMLLAEPFFKTFTKNAVREPKGPTEAIVALSAASREEVDVLVTQALSTGGTPATDAKDHGFMYVRTFYDPDGHHWELFWMDPAKAGGQ